MWPARGIRRWAGRCVLVAGGDAGFFERSEGVLGCEAAAMSSSRCGACPKRKTEADCLSLAKSRKSAEVSAPGKSKSLRRIFCLE